ncbi:MAG: hypothetical protein AMXMBFR83_09290 [Phycisphaerae bacterium]
MWQRNYDPWHQSSPPALTEPADSGLVPVPQDRFNLPTLTALLSPDLTSPRTGVEYTGPRPRWTLAEAAVGAAILAVVLALVLPPILNGIDLARFKVKTDGFIYSGKHRGIWVDETGEDDPIRLDVAAALQALRNTGNPKAIQCVNWYESLGWESNGHHIIAINVEQADTDLAPCAATEPHLDRTIILHHAYVERQYNYYKQWGVKGIAILLFAEWQHQNEPGKSEPNCQTDLENWRSQVPAFQNVAPEVIHGRSELAR